MTNHRFWSTQPVNIGDANSAIEQPKDLNENSIRLPGRFKFVDLTLNDIDKIHELLSFHYVEDDESTFRLLYSKEMLLWQFNNPCVKKNYLLGVERDDELFGFVFAIEHNLVIDNKIIKAISVNFLCVVKELRNKRLAPLIIKEITRRANVNGIYQAIFTGGIKLPFILTSARYYHRIIDRKTLVDSEYCMRTYDEKSAEEKYKINYRKNDNYRYALDKDYQQMFNLYNEECNKHKLYDKMNFETFVYNLKTKENVVYAFVKEIDDKIVAFGSFYILNNLVIRKNKEIKTAYLYYHSSENHKEMIEQLLIFASQINCAMFNIINMNIKKDILDDLLFCIGDGVLNYYLYNYETSPIDSKDLFFYLP
ncbi:hypothetical protein GVAV_001407 [Gurleya vavrai]